MGSFQLRLPLSCKPSASVKGHSVSWNHPFSEEICLYLSKSEKIAPSPLRIEFRQLATGMKRSELIGKVSIELSDYIGAETTPRQYLLSASRVNSMAIITLTLSPVEGDEQSYVSRGADGRAPLALLVPSLHNATARHSRIFIILPAGAT